MPAPNRLSARYKRRQARPLVDALIAFHLGRASEAHYYELAGALFIASEIIEVVARHRHLRREMDGVLRVLRSVFDRHTQRTVKDAYWSATSEELSTLQLGVDIYTALLETTPGTQARRAMQRVMNQLQRQMMETDKDALQMRKQDSGTR